MSRLREQPGATLGQSFPPFELTGELPAGNEIIGSVGLTPTGQVLAAASTSVVLASDQPAIPITGTVTVTGGLTDAQLRATPVPVSFVGGTGLTNTELRATPVPVSGTVAVTGVATETTLAALNAKVTAVNTGSVVVSSSALPTGASTNALQTTLIGYVDGIEALLAGTLLVNGSGSTQPISAVNLPLPTGAATAVRQDTGNSSLTSIDSKIITVNTGAVVVSSSALPTGASTSALQTTGNASLSSLDGKTPALGQAAMAVSTPVVLASDQPAIAVSGTIATGGLTDTQLRATAIPIIGYPIEGALDLILTELKVISRLLQLGLSINDEPDDIRDDLTLN